MKELKELRGKRIVAADGAAGTLNDVYFDTANWKVRYIAVQTGLRRAGESLLLPAETASHLEDGDVRVAQQRGEFHPMPGARSLSWLFTGREIARYEVQGTDGKAGEVDELLVHADWSIGGLAVRARSWLFSESRIMLNPSHIVGVDRGQRTVKVSLTSIELLRLPRLVRSGE